MADITNVLIAAKDHRIVDVGDFHIRNRFTASATAGAIGYAANGDDIKLITIAAPLRLLECTLAISATLGAACTMQLFHNRGGTRTALTAASTATAANLLRMTAQPIDMVAGDQIEIRVAGANILTAAAIVNAIVFVARS